MKKILLLISIIVICMCFVSCLNISRNTPQPAASNNAQESEQPGAESVQPQPTETEPDIPPEASGAALVYMDPKIDMFIIVHDATWKYTKELYQGKVYFYPGGEDPTVSPNGFSISSQPKREGGIEVVWESWEPSLEHKYEDFAWTKEDNITVGNYTGNRYHFSTVSIVGDIIIWETNEALYICSLTSGEDSYDANYALLADALSSFKTLKEAGEQ